MNNTSMANTSAKNATDSSMTSMTVPSKAEGIALCSAFILASLLISMGNLLTIVLFALNKTLRKKSLFLVINMSFADLMLGTVSLPIYTYDVGADYQLWKGGWTMFIRIFFLIFDTIFSQASLISAAFISSERFYAIYWPFKHKTLSTRAYRIVIFVVWTLALLFAAIKTTLAHYISDKHAVYAKNSYTLILILIVCSCNISIWRKFQQGSVVSQQQNRASRNKRLTKTLLFVSVLALLSWLPLVIMNYLIFVLGVSIPLRFYDMTNVVNYSNSFVNPILYALRIPEFKQALAFCCLGRGATIKEEGGERRNNAASAVTPSTELTTLQTDSSHINLAFEQEIMDTKL
ncbi:adenosine receptor A3-like [Oculina patagonica]